MSLNKTRQLLGVLLLLLSALCAADDASTRSVNIGAGGDVPELSVLEKLALLSAMAQARKADDSAAAAPPAQAMEMVKGMIEVEPGVWIPDDGEGGMHLAAMRAPREPKAPFDFKDFEEVDLFSHIAFHKISERRAHDKHLGQGGVDRGLHLHPEDFYDYTINALNPDHVILDSAETAYVRGTVEAFKAEHGLVGDIPLYTGYLVRGYPQSLMHRMQERLYKHRYGSVPLTDAELRFTRK